MVFSSRCVLVLARTESLEPFATGCLFRGTVTACGTLTTRARFPQLLARGAMLVGLGLEVVGLGPFCKQIHDDRICRIGTKKKNKKKLVQSCQTQSYSEDGSDGSNGRKQARYGGRYMVFGKSRLFGGCTLQELFVTVGQVHGVAVNWGRWSSCTH